MSEFEISKKNIVSQLRSLCAHCQAGRAHSCPLQSIAKQVRSISGVPLIVNSEFKGILWNHLRQI
jgi:hypothetical protein